MATSGEGRPDIVDVARIARHAVGLGPSLPFPDKCNVIGPPGGGLESCDDADYDELRLALAQLPAMISDVCGPASH